MEISKKKDDQICCVRILCITAWKLVKQCRDRVLLEACQEVNLWLVQHEAYYSHQR